MRVFCLAVLIWAGGTTEDASLDERAREFIAAFRSGEVSRLLKLWSEQSPTRTVDRRRLARLLDNRVEFDASITDLRQEAGRALATLELRALSAPKTLLESYAIEFQLQDNRWQVWRLVSAAAGDADRLMNAGTAKGTAGSALLLRELLHRGGESMAGGDLSRSLSAFTLAGELAEKAEDSAARAAWQRGLGSVAFARGDSVAAERHLQESVRLAEAAHDGRAKAKTLVTLARLREAAGDYPGAEALIIDALALFRSAHDRVGEAQALNGLGNLRGSMGDYAGAKATFEQALKIYRELNDPNGLSTVLNSLGIINRRQANYQEALDSFQKSLALSREADDLKGIADALGNIGNVLNAQGNYLDALHAYQESITVNERLGNVVNVAAVLTGIGQMYFSLGNYPQAATFHSKTYALMKEKGYKEGMAIALHSLGGVASAQGQLRRALEHYEEALRLDTELQDPAGRAIDLADIGHVHARLGQHSEAEEAFSRSIELAEQIGDRDTMIVALSNRAELMTKMREYEKGLDSARRAASIADEVGNRRRSWQTRVLTARIYRSLRRLDDARNENERAIAIVEDLRRGLAGPAMAAQAFESMAAPYQEMVSTLVEQNEIGKAFEYSERAKARVLLDLLRDGRTDITTMMTDAERQREKELLSRLTELNRKSRGSASSDPKARADLTASLQQARLAYEAFLDTLYAARPELAMRRGEMSPLPADHLGELLGERRADALLEFVVTEEKTFLFAISRGASDTPDLRVHTIPVGREELAALVSRFREQLATRDPVYSAAARSLYERLLRPAEKALRGARVVCIVPDGALWELPFQALQPSSGRFLLDDRVVFLAPSLTVLRVMLQRKRPGPDADSRLVAFANPVVPHKTTERLRDVYRSLSLEPIVETETEVRKIASFYRPDRVAVHIGPAAREEIAKRDVPAFDVLHFATHGILDDQNALYSRLLFSPPAVASEDGLLEAREIMQLTLRADLAVLSACETARGRVGAGEGLIGMAWAFFVAGCPTTVASQWRVGSASTADLMIAFHRNLHSSGGRSAEALRHAALSLRKKPAYRHPYYWAAFVVMGAPQ